ncbi:MAG: tetratricopeptide repeat protein [Myxococcaceae bacterium]
MWPVLCLTLLAAPADLNPVVRQALSLEQSGDDVGALAALDKLISQQPGAELPRLEAARIRLKRAEDVDRAEADLEAVRSRTPENPRAQYLWGLLMEERGKSEEARDAFELAVFYRPLYADARLRLAALALAGSDWVKAETHYRVVVRAQPELAQAKLQLAHVLEKQSRFDDAERVLKGLLASQPKSVAVVRRLTELYERMDRPKLAAKLRQSLEPEKPTKKKMRPLKKSRR